MSSSQVSAVREGAGVVDRIDRGQILVTGTDRADYLQGLLTNDVVALQAGEGCYAAYLTAQGRTIADLDLFVIEGGILLDVHASAVPNLVERLQDLVFTEEVEIADRTDAWAALGLHGPSSPDLLRRALEDGVAVERIGETVDRLEPYQCLAMTSSAGPIIAARTDPVGVIGFALFCERGGVGDLSRALAGAGAVAVDADTIEVMRVEAGRPAFPVDIDTETIPLEAGIEQRAISETKGCYVGQEVIIRVLHRGQGRVARKLVGLVIDVDKRNDGSEMVPAGGAVLHQGGQAVGKVTSAVFSPALGKPIALGYLPRELSEIGTRVQIDLGTTEVEAVVTARPFVTSPIPDWLP